MIRKIRRRIVTETKQIALVVNSNASGNLFCELCGEMSALISPLAAAKILKISPREIFRLIENGEIHFVETRAPDNQVFVCFKSLATIAGGGGRE
ncbi:MAG: hypothetical protein WA584_12430 [Pyrinomonadaceae bacterium]